MYNLHVQMPYYNHIQTNWAIKYSIIVRNYLKIQNNFVKIIEPGCHGYIHNKRSMNIFIDFHKLPFKFRCKQGREDTMATEKWFHPNLSGRMAEELLLRKGIKGCFLIRPSQSSPDNLTLSVKQESGVVHIRIVKANELYHLQNFADETFSTVNELVKYYIDNPMKEKDGPVIEILVPVLREESITSLWYHSRMDQEEAKTCLMSKGRKGSFLVRDSLDSSDFIISLKGSSTVIDITVLCNNGLRFSIESERDEFDSVQNLIEHYRNNPIRVKELENEEEEEEIRLLHPFSNTSFPTHSIGFRINELAKQSHDMVGKTGFWDEFEDLQKEAIESQRNCEEGLKIENLHKNRYKNVIPLDHTIVTLVEPDAYGSTYINANYITEVEAVEPSYIATQGCLEGTIEDFWSMIWQERTLVIVMLTDLMERGRNKCCQYWPESIEPGVEHGSVFITSLEETVQPHQILRHFLIEGEEEERHVFQFQLRGWSEIGIPQDPKAVLDFMNEVNAKVSELEPQSPGPVVVHCNDGIGRTGAYIAVDTIIKRIEKQGWNERIDVRQCVELLRGQRSGMVKTDAQYRFIFQALHCYISGNQKCIMQQETETGVTADTLKQGMSPLLS